MVDNASSDGRTHEVVVKAEAIYVREDRPGLDFARNAEYGQLQVISSSTQMTMFACTPVGSNAW